MPTSSSLRDRAGRLLLAGGICLLVLLAVRLGVAVSTTRTGGPFVASFWKGAFLAALGIPSPPLGEREPREQADYWLGRITSLSRDDPKGLSGAAWVLDLPQSGYLKTKVRPVASEALLAVSGLRPPFDLNQEANTVAEAEFEQRVRTLREELSRRAVELNPSDRELWRARALLAFSGTFWGAESWTPRTDGWRELLDECGAHDPENGLYDAIAALQDFRMASSQVFGQDHDTLEVRDAARLAEARKSLERAGTLSALQFGTDQASSSWRFLESIGESPIKREEAVSGAQVHNRIMLLMRELIRFQRGLSGNAEQAGDFATAKAILVRALDLPDRLGRRDGNTVNAVALSRLFSGVVAASLLSLEEREPGTLTLEEYERYRGLQSDLRQKEQRTRSDASSLPGPPAAVAWLPLTAAFVLFNPAFAVLTVLIGGGLLLLAVLVRPCEADSAAPAAPWKQIVVVWIAGWLASLAIAIVWAVKLRAQRAPPLVVDDYLFREAVVKMGYLLGGAFLWAGKSLERLAILAALLISTVWTVVRYRKRASRGEVATTGRGVVFACARDGGRLMVAAAVLLVAVQLSLLPTMIDFTEAQYRYWEQWMSTPGADWRLLDAAAAADGSGGSNGAG